MFLLLAACTNPKDAAVETGEESALETGETASEDTGADSGQDTGGDTSPAFDPVVIGYFVEWGVYDRGYEVAALPADQLTHVNYAFADLSAEGDCLVYDAWAALDRNGGNFAALVALKQAHPHLRTLISVGGWTLSDNFSAVASTPAGRERFATSCVDFMVSYGFDGIDVDWEYPGGGGKSPGTPEDAENYTLVLQAVRAELDARGDYLLTIAAPAGPDKIANLDPVGIAGAVDWINLMSYDFHGGWDATTDHHAPLTASAGSPKGSSDPLTVDAAVRAYLDAGVAPEQLVMGVPLYGRGWSGVPDAGDGLFQSNTGSCPGTWEAGIVDYDDLSLHYLTDSSYTRFWSEEAQAPWLYSAREQVMISYDDEESLGVKLDYIRTEGLRGVMTWEADADTEDHALIRQMSAALR